MSLRTEAKDYYEAQSQKRILYIPNLSMFLMKLHEQVLRLPHEVQDISTNQPMGSTEEDIVNSIERGVDLVYVMLAPTRAHMGEKEGDILEYIEPEEFKKLNKFHRAMKKLQWCYLCMDDGDILNDRTVIETLPGDEETYEIEGGQHGKENDGSVPASVQPPNDEAVGPVEKEVHQHLA